MQDTSFDGNSSFGTATPPLCAVPGTSSALLTFLPDTGALRPSCGNQKDMPREGGTAPARPGAGQLHLGPARGAEATGQLSAKCLQQPRSHQGRRSLCPFRLPSALLAQCPSCGPALGSRLEGDFPASGHTRASFPLQPAAKASLLLMGRQAAGTSPAPGRGSEEVCECSPVPALHLSVNWRQRDGSQVRSPGR